MTEKDDLDSQYRQALGYLTAVVPEMLIDVENPLGMAEQINERFLELENQLTDQRLIGWLVFICYQFACAQSAEEREEYDLPLQVPEQIMLALVDRGWVTRQDDENGPGLYVTDLGAGIADINAVEWGVELALDDEKEVDGGN